MSQPAAETWEGIYYPNPIPLSSSGLLAAALLFDRLHIPGVSLPQVPLSAADRDEFKEWLPLAFEPTQQRLVRWTVEQPVLSDFIYYPDQVDSLDQEWKFTLKDPAFEHEAMTLLDDTYAAGNRHRTQRASCVSE